MALTDGEQEARDADPQRDAGGSRMPHRLGLQGRVSAAVAALFTLLALLAVIVLILAVWRSEQESLELRAQATARLKAEGVAQPLWNLDRDTVVGMMADLKSDPDLAYAVIFDDLGRRYVEVGSEQDDVVTGGAPIMFRDGRLTPRSVGWIDVHLSRDRLTRNTWSRVGWALLVWLAAIFSVTLVLARLLRRMVIGPLQTLASAIRSTAAGASTVIPDFGRSADLGDMPDALRSLIASRARAQQADQAKAEAESMRRQEAEAQRQRLLLTSILDAIPVPVVTRDLNGICTHANRAYERFSGLPASMVEGKLPEDLLAPEDAARQRDEDAAVLAEGNAIRSEERTLRHKDSSERNIVVQKAPILGIGDRTIGVVEAIVDLTEQKRAESALRAARDGAERAFTELKSAQDQLVQAEKLASLGELVAGMAHEINTPVGIALTAASFLDEEREKLQAALTAESLSRDDLEVFLTAATNSCKLILGNCERAADLIHSFKQVATDRALGQRRRFILGPYLQEVATSVGPLLSRGGHKLTLDVQEGLEVDGYPGPLAQVVSNFVANAVTHAYKERRGGQMSLRAKAVAPDSIEILFTDDGAGIPPDVLPKVFDPFFTTNRGGGGTGLGLHISHSIVTGLFGGQLTVDSTVGKGTRFLMRFPRIAPDSADARLMAGVTPGLPI